jgi:hypothetical protein
MASIKGITRITVPAGIAKPSPAIGQALGPLGVNMMEFCKVNTADLGTVALRRCDHKARQRLRAGSLRQSAD